MINPMLSRKRSRPIQVDGENYRWNIAPNDKWVTIIIQDVSSNGQRLEIRVNTDINRMWIEFPHIEDLNLKVIKPALVEKLIRMAIKFGWSPKRSGRPLKMIFTEKEQLIALNKRQSARVFSSDNNYR